MNTSVAIFGSSGTLNLFSLQSISLHSLDVAFCEQAGWALQAEREQSVRGGSGLLGHGDGRTLGARSAIKLACLEVARSRADELRSRRHIGKVDHEIWCAEGDQ